MCILPQSRYPALGNSLLYGRSTYTTVRLSSTIYYWNLIGSTLKCMVTFTLFWLYLFLYLILLYKRLICTSPRLVLFLYGDHNSQQSCLRRQNVITTNKNYYCTENCMRLREGWKTQRYQLTAVDQASFKFGDGYG